MSGLNINISSILKNLKSVKKLCESRGCGLVPVITGSTHDYTVVDISESKKMYCVGGSIDFIFNYNSVIRRHVK